MNGMQNGNGTRNPSTRSLNPSTRSLSRQRRKRRRARRQLAGAIGAALVELEFRRPGALTPMQLILATQYSDGRPKGLERLIERMDVD
jgi:hypothetical protein